MLWQYVNQPAPVEKMAPPATTLGAGTPLDTSTAAITVLTPATDPSPEGQQGQVSITVLPPTPAMVPAKPTPPLALLLPVVEQAYAQGGPNARRMATLGITQAGTQQNAQEAYTALRNATPENGPITPAVLMLETTRVLTLDAPVVSATTVAAPATQPDGTLSGWFRFQLQRFVTLRQATPESTMAPAADAWHAALGTVQQHIARNNAPEAVLILSQPPLATDNRLDVLRHLLAEYTDLQTRLEAVRAATLPLITGEGQ